MKPIATILVLTVSLLVLAAGCAKGATATPEDVQPTPTPQVEPTKKLAPQAGPKDNEPGTSVSPLAPEPGLSPLPQAPVIDVPAQAAGAVEWAKADLAAHAGIAASQIAVLSVEPVEWPDASLGCPQPGMVYAQVITPGYYIVLGAGNQIYTYHSASGQDTAVFCEQGPFQSPLPKPPLPGQE